MEKRLHRNSKGKIIAGVCSGLADYFAIDPVLVRLVFVILALHSGIGILAYIILWIVAPMRPAFMPATNAAGTSGEFAFEQGEADNDEYAPAQTPSTPTREGGRGSFTGGIVLIIIGALFLLDNFIPHFGLDDFWPLLLIAIGAGMLWNSWPRHANSTAEVES